MSTISDLLIIDDNPEDQQVYKRYISKIFGEPIKIHTLEKGAEGLNYLRTNMPDCVLLDYNLPDMTGIDFLKRLKEQQEITTPIIMLTGTGNEKIAIEALKSGAYDYLNKGELQPQILHKTIANAVEKSVLTKRIHEKEEQIKHLAYHDYLTNVPNRAQFEISAKMALDNAKKFNRNFAILFIDLDRFKAINDKFGHETGDLLLKEVVKLFAPCLGENDILARVGGDEFAIITDHMNEPEYAGAIANKLIEALAIPLQINGKKIKITPSIGISIYPTSGKTILNLLSNADIALYKAKNEGKNTFRYFTDELNIYSQHQMNLETALDDALEQKDFYLNYQPIFNIDQNTIFGIEALLRSNNPALKEVPINTIIKLADRTGLIIPLGNLILEQVFKQVLEWQGKTINNFKISVNLSIRQIEHKDWAQTFERLIKKYPIDPKQFIFELTESEVFYNLMNINKQLSFLRNLGCEIFFDDFGTGYSSLNLIRELPITGLKIDRSFIKDIESNKEDAKMIKSIALLAHELGLILVVEGIETESQLNLLKSYPEIKGQGFYFSKPLEAAEIFKVYLKQ